MALGDKITWSKADFKWSKAPTEGAKYTWDDVRIVLSVVQGASGDEISWNVEQLSDNDKKRFIKLVCKVKGIETYSGQKTIRDNIKVTAEDCELVVKEVLGIDLTVENIHV
tara:strand:+ start:19 stop:351 length:333 start_codon:yes stop_codon:yes gene_type:complete